MGFAYLMLKVMWLLSLLLDTLQTLAGRLHKQIGRVKYEPFLAPSFARRGSSLAETN